MSNRVFMNMCGSYVKLWKKCISLFVSLLDRLCYDRRNIMIEMLFKNVLMLVIKCWYLFFKELLENF